MERKHVVILGGGFGGLAVAKGLRNAEVDITLVDKLNHHLFQPLLYQVATGALSPGDIAQPLRQIVHKQKNIECIMATATSVNKEEKKLLLHDGNMLSYDYLVLAPGSKDSYFGHDAWEKFAPGLKTVRDALQIREKILSCFELAEKSHDPEEIKKLLTFVIIGGGPTGVELAGAIAEIALQSVVKTFRNIDTRKSRIILIEGMPRILPTWPESLSEQAKKDLESLHVEVMTSTLVTNISEGLVQTNVASISASTILWAAGCKIAPIIQTLQTPLDKQGRALVEQDLSIPTHPEIFVIGDAAGLMDSSKKPLPGLAQVAIQEGAFVSNIIKKDLPKEIRGAFGYHDKGSMATIGKGKAVAQIGNHLFKGIPAWLLWCLIHIFYIIGFTNRLLVFIKWSALYLFNKREVMLITRPLD